VETSCTITFNGILWLGNLEAVMLIQCRPSAMFPYVAFRLAGRLLIMLLAWQARVGMFSVPTCCILWVNVEGVHWQPPFMLSLGAGRPWLVRGPVCAASAP